MKRVHQFFGRALLASGAFMLFLIITDFTGPAFPLWLKNWTFAVFGLSLAVFAFTYKRWSPEDPPQGPPGTPENRDRNE
ncbi:MAG: hypothetical protein OXN15_00325 [Chloroflexota bacterium]|nr:hypothetical protein [Chloroflexota bacterium]MDE2970152.1 hypothetical protein [Chloroflexota bacterium]